MSDCTDCKYCVEQDYGYSNYTVEGTEVDCLLNLNPKFPIDRWYGKEPSLEYAGSCTKYTEGPHIQLDVDGETTPEECTDDEEVLKLYRATTDAIEER